MERDVEKLKSYLAGAGVREVVHPSNTEFLSHLDGVYRWLERWRLPAHVKLAGLFHSVYGTQAFEEFSMPLSRRGEIRALIGEAAERLVYAYCALTYQSLGESLRSGGAPRLWDRFEERPLPVTGREYTDLLWIKLADILEQDARARAEVAPEQTIGIRYGWKRLAERLGGAALESWREVYGPAK
ncbi:MAG TPA: hypothetical protein VF591_19540 [Pyrinomonadaceae bacterium]|jgi:hypothetical protein